MTGPGRRNNRRPFRQSSAKGRARAMRGTQQGQPQSSASRTPRSVRDIDRELYRRMWLRSRLRRQAE